MTPSLPDITPEQFQVIIDHLPDDVPFFSTKADLTEAIFCGVAMAAAGMPEDKREWYIGDGSDAVAIINDLDEDDFLILRSMLQGYRLAILSCEERSTLDASTNWMGFISYLKEENGIMVTDDPTPPWSAEDVRH